MAKTAPDDFPYVPTGMILAKEPVVSGNSSSVRGLYDIATGLNHAIRYLTPTVIAQWMQFWQYATATAGNRYLTTADQATDTIMTMRLLYRVPTIAGIGSAGGAAVDRLQLRAWASRLGSRNGTLRVTTGDAGSPFDTTVSATGDWSEHSISAPYLTTRAYDDVGIWTQAGASGEDIALKSLTAWIEAGANPCPAGIDVEPYAADEALATYMPRLVAEKLEALARERMGVVVNYSDDYENLGRGDGSYTGTATVNTKRFMDRLEAKFGPYTTELRVHINGYYNGPSAGTITVFTDSNPTGVTFTMPAKAVFDASPTTQWQTDVITLADTERLQPWSDRVHIDIVSPNTTTTTIASIAVWEEPS